MEVRRTDDLLEAGQHRCNLVAYTHLTSDRKKRRICGLTSAERKLLSRPNSDRLGERILAREEDAFLEFQFTYRRLFLTHLLRQGMPPIDAEDLAVNLVTDIPLRAIDSWRPEVGAFDPWVLTVMRNAAVDWWRRREEMVPLDEDLASREDEVFLPDSPKLSELQSKLEQLSPPERLVLELRYSRSDTTFAEMAAELTGFENGKLVTGNAAKVRHFRALRKIRALYGISDPKGEQT